MVYELKDTEKVKELFAGWQETLIYSCLQKVMGEECYPSAKRGTTLFGDAGLLKQGDFVKFIIN